jgi:glycosyltransferase involved in cell wall biosynthesis
VNWTEVRMPAVAHHGLGGELRRILPAPVTSSRHVHRAFTALRSRLNPLPADDLTVTLYPFSQTPARAQRSVVTLHDLKPFQREFWSPVYTEIIRKNVERAAALVVSWPHPYQQVLEMFPEARSKTVLIPLPAFHGRPSDMTTQPDPHLLLYPSGTAPHKNHRTLVDAMTLLPEFRLVCPGPLKEPQARFLLTRVMESDLRGRVMFPGFVSTEELKRLYARAAAVVVPSRWEAASGAVFEAFSWGLPVACADVAPLRAQVDFAGGDACFFEPTKPESLASAVRRLLADRERYSAASRVAGARLATRTWTDTARDYAAVLGWVADGCRGPVPQSSFVSQATTDRRTS